MEEIKLKPCPFRVHGHRTQSLTVVGEYFYNETFMPCMGEDCPAFRKLDNTCTNYGANYDMRRKDKDIEAWDRRAE